MSENVFFNPGPDSVVIDNAGHILDAQDRLTGNPRNNILSRLVASGQLVDLGAVEDQQVPNTEVVDPEDSPGE